MLWCDFLIEEGVLERPAFEAANAVIAERYARGAITPAEFCAFYAATLAGRSAADWAPLRQRFVAAVIAPRLGAQAFALVERHRAAGDRLVLTTATNRFLTEPIAERLGIADLIASELELAAGVFTGRNAGVLNMREGKVTRLKAWLATEDLGEAALSDATFYSDSINDLALLSRRRRAGGRRSGLASRGRGGAALVAGAAPRPALARRLSRSPSRAHERGATRR